MQKEEERLRASVRRESKQKRIRERTATGRGMSGGYLEPDREGYEDSEDEGGISLTAIKKQFKRGGPRGRLFIFLFYVQVWLKRSLCLACVILQTLRIKGHRSIPLKKMRQILKIARQRNLSVPKHCQMTMTMNPMTTREVVEQRFE